MSAAGFNVLGNGLLLTVCVGAAGAGPSISGAFSYGRSSYMK